MVCKESVEVCVCFSVKHTELQVKFLLVVSDGKNTFLRTCGEHKVRDCKLCMQSVENIKQGFGVIIACTLLSQKKFS